MQSQNLTGLKSKAIKEKLKPNLKLISLMILSGNKKKKSNGKTGGNK